MPPAGIRTPDQRLRVFLSSTLRELEPERRAARAAIEQLHLAPVMFELGARPHPPRALYRSYLAQSDVFVGLYWQQYGWVAPDEDISGLEDEYRLSTGLPSLIYIKQPAPDRDERLSELLDRIRDDDRSSYKSFSEPEELAELLRGDLATLLAERFDAARTAADATRAEPERESSGIPAPYTPIVGRHAERDLVAGLLARREARIVTLTGPGGIGKSRLAIEIAADAATDRDVAFVLLEAVEDPDRVVTAIARALHVRDSGGEGSLEDRVIAAIDDRDVLLVLDNMEHLLSAAPLLVRMISAAPHLQLLVTSRAPLRVRAERVVDVGPLELAGPDTTAETAEGSSAIDLFVQRAAAVRPGFALTADNVATVVAICRALDGVPLAIELAAARVRLLSVEQILARLDSALTLLSGGARDLPERQRTLRETIRWSVDLLDPPSQEALYALGSFSGTFRLESAESVLTAAGVADPLSTLEALIDASLVSRADRGAHTTFRLLSLVRAYARETGTPELRRTADTAWISTYRSLAERAESGMQGLEQLAWLDTLELEIENLAAVGRALIDRREFDSATEYVWALYLPLWIGGYLGLAQAWAAEILQTARRDGIPLTDRTRAIALYYANAIRFWQDMEFDPAPDLARSRELFLAAADTEGAALSGISLSLALLGHPAGPDVPAAMEVLHSSLAEFESIDDAWGQSMVLVMLGRIGLLAGDAAQALASTERSLELAIRDGERLAIAIAQNHRGWARFVAGDLEGARTDFGEGLDTSLSLQHDEGVAYGLEAFVALRASAGDARAAGLLLGAARTLRRRAGILNPGAFEYYLLPLAALRESGRGTELDQAIHEGEHLTVTEAMELVRD